MNAEILVRRGTPGVYCNGKKIPKCLLKYMKTIRKIAFEDGVSTPKEICERTGTPRGIESLYSLERRGLAKRSQTDREQWVMTADGLWAIIMFDYIDFKNKPVSNNSSPNKG